MIKVFCVDIGYSFKSECRKWKDNPNSYPGQALYGINYFQKFDVEPVFEWCEHGYFFGKWYAIADEIIKVISLIKYRKAYEVIYIPHAYYSRWIILLKKMKIIKKPVVVCMHNKNNLWGLINVCDFVVTINPDLEMQIRKSHQEIKVKYVPLLPGMENANEITYEEKYDIVSIGNTYRDYRLLVDVMRDLPYSCLIVTSQSLEDVPENVTLINKNLAYSECLKLYMQARIILIPIVKAAEKGVFGLTSLVDALYVEKPVIVTHTVGMGIPIAQYGLGAEVEIGSKTSMRTEICKLLEEPLRRKGITENIKEFKKNNNMENSAKCLCEIFREIVGQ